MSDALELFIVAGEPSGDRIAADLVDRLRARMPVVVSGVGGGELIAKGLNTLFPMDDISVMGITDVLKRLPLILWRVEQTSRALARRQPEIAVLIDAQDFTKRVARRARRLGYLGPMLLYVAPTVWARAPARAAKIKPLFDEVLAVLPFEPEVMMRLGGPPTSYVGHPALSEVRTADPLQSGKIALLPGSRGGELRRHLPLMRDLAVALAEQPNVTGFFLPTLPSLTARLRAETANWPVQVDVIDDRAVRHELYEQTLLAISSAGTATLELALAKVPMVLTYVMDGPQSAVYWQHGSPPVGLPNIISGRVILPEFVSRNPDMDEMRRTVMALAQNKQARQSQIEAFDELARLMRHGTADAPRQDPADRVLSHLKRLSVR